MMITFSTSAIRLRFLYFTLYSECSALLTPALDGLTQLEVGDHARDQGEPERHGAEHQDGDQGLARVDVEGGQRADHAALHAAHPAGHREQVAEHPDEEG